MEGHVVGEMIMFEVGARCRNNDDPTRFELTGLLVPGVGEQWCYAFMGDCTLAWRCNFSLA
jgi:hypothetical protein